MATWFSRLFQGKKSIPSHEPILVDLHGQPIKVGDEVEALRYELGIAVLVNGPDGLEYQSVTTGEKVSFLRMVDAATRFQKVIKR